MTPTQVVGMHAGLPVSPASLLHSRPSAGRRAVLVGALLVAAIASFNLFTRLGDPARPVWDESYYLTAIARYELGFASFASHPPLGLILMAAGDRAAGSQRAGDLATLARVKTVGVLAAPPALAYAHVRLASGLAGVVAAVLFFLLAAELTGDALLGAAMTTPFVFDTGLLAQFRAAQLDSFQLCFATAALLFLARAHRRPSGRARWLGAFGVACGLTAMVRANGLVLLIAGVPLTLVAIIGAVPLRQRLRAVTRRGLAIGGGAALAIMGVMLVHLAIAARPMPADWPAARADAPYVAGVYRAWLDGRTPLTPAAAWAGARGYAAFMAADLAGVGRHDANSSSPWGWPVGQRPIVYRWDSDGRTTAYVVLAANLPGWLLSLAGPLGVAVLLLRRGADRVLPAALLLAWAALYVTDVLLARTRVMYLYHYFLPLLLGWAMAAWLAGRLVTAEGPWAARRTGAVLLALTLAVFIAQAPLATHRPLTDAACRARAWLAGPALCARTPARP